MGYNNPYFKEIIDDRLELISEAHNNGTLQDFYKKWKDAKIEDAARLVDDCIKLFKEHPSPKFHSVGNTFQN